ncbi:GNAT family N-acetyltransferase [Paenibacillus polymyxa]|uniref:GNAT family N-acetyltransferase n=1 Tax=Paenibacillus polymyxa TaxID=1406 RepID=A0A8I1LVY4_PAEPO|nr:MULTISPECIES: GNAT family N-acetyltransferase [Paenibacillus]KAF6570239.1 GNAT family N-acetyltransferase [Paenibacillus sp. EKM206P]KAF6585632.1 GNAT family N-acetyltransferase [Paenibacillus sp. EKM205P]MBM0635498.1 GNAT family N-acetyltransferase [Paenibacillus polymyxa]
MFKSIFLKEYSTESQSQVVDLILHIQKDEYNIAITKEDQPDLLDIENFYQRGNGNFWVALREGTVVGTVALLDIGDRKAALRKMFVKQNYRGKTFNVSNQLLHHAIGWAKERSIEEIYLGTTPQFVTAHRFYEKNGFVSVDPGELPISFPVMKVDKKFYRYIIQ